jgi:hypothetical protein
VERVPTLNKVLAPVVVGYVQQVVWGIFVFEVNLGVDAE